MVMGDVVDNTNIGIGRATKGRRAKGF